jgi:hypothetical protein
MAELTPEQRAQMSAMMGNSGVSVSGKGAMQICITPEMAKRDVPVVDKDGACSPTNVQRDGNHMTYAFSCASRGEAT